jgi:hypothetical protein
VVEDVGVVAAGILQGVGQNGHPVKGVLGIDAFGKQNDGGGEPSGVKNDRTDRISNNFTK